MKHSKFLMVLLTIIILVSALTGCSRNGSNGSNATATHIGASKTSKDTISAVLTNADYTSGITLNWASRVGKSSATLTGLQQIAFILDGDEMMDGTFKDRPLNSITIEFTGKTTGKKVKLSTSLTGNLTSLAGKITNLSVDNDYFRIEDYTLQFYPHYFNVGEEVVIKATFIYKGEGIIDQLTDSKSAEGYFTFTVGADTGETFTNALDGIADFFKDFGKGNGNTGSNNGSNNSTTPTTPKDYLSVRFSVDGTNAEGTVARYEADAKKNVITLPNSTLSLTCYTREDSRYNVTKAYIIPVSVEGNWQKLKWCNDYFSESCHKFDVDLSQFSGQTITLCLEFLDGAEWNPMPDHYYGYITVKVP